MVPVKVSSCKKQRLAWLIVQKGAFMKWVLVNSQICCKAWNTVLRLSFEEQCPNLGQNQSDKKATNTATTHRSSLSEGHLLFRSVTLGPLAGSVVRKWKRKWVFCVFNIKSLRLSTWVTVWHLGKAKLTCLCFWRKKLCSQWFQLVSSSRKLPNYFLERMLKSS